jgi:dynein heavy chain
MGFPEYLSYGHRAMIRTESMRFLRLAYLLDFLALDSLTGIYHESVN